MTSRPSTLRAVSRPTVRYVPAEQAPRHDPRRPSVESLAAKYAALGATGPVSRVTWRTHKPKLSEGAWRQIARLRPTYTLAQLAALFGRHATTISEGLAARGYEQPDLRAGRKSPRRAVSA